MQKKHVVIALITLVSAIILIFGIVVASSYNKAVRLSNEAENKRAQIGVAIEARFDKLEELLNAITGLEEHVEAQLEKITSARAALATANASDIAKDVDGIQSGFNSIIVLIEDNPNTYIATSAYNNYMAEISATINMITSARTQYNAAVTNFNNQLETFPSNLILGMFDFAKMPLYEPEVSLS